LIFLPLQAVAAILEAHIVAGQGKLDLDSKFGTDLSGLVDDKAADFCQADYCSDTAVRSYYDYMVANS
jgi:hypothetical protein